MDSGVRVDGPIDLGPNSSQVVLKVATPHFKTIDATEAANNTVTISTTERLAPIVMKNIKDLNLGAGVTLRPDVKNISSIDDDDLVERSTITGNINVAQGAVLDLTVLMHDPKTLALPTTNISGTGKVLIPSGGSSLSLAGANGVTFEIQNVGDNNHVVAGHQYILPRATSYTLSAKNPEEGITYDNGQAVAQQTPPPAPQKTLSLEIFKVTDKATAAISVDIDPFNDKAPEEFLAEVKAELQKKPELARFIVLKGGEHKPVRDVTERKDTIKWYIQEAGKVVITGDPAGSKDVPFDVAWNEAGTEQVVTYTLGTPPQTHVYKNTGVIVANPTAPVTVPQAQFFSSIPVTLEPRTSTLAVVPEEDPTRTLMAVDEAAYAAPYTPAAKKALIFAELAKLPAQEYILLEDSAVMTDEPNTPSASIVWKAKKAGKLVMPAGKPAQAFTVTTTNSGQTVSYTVPNPPTGKEYRIGGKAVTPGQSVTLEGDARFAVVVVEEVNVANGESNAGGNTNDTPKVPDTGTPKVPDTGAGNGANSPKPGTFGTATRPADATVGQTPQPEKGATTSKATNDTTSVKTPAQPKLAATGMNSGAMGVLAVLAALCGAFVLLRRRK